jgi:hypothetical protein
MLRLDQRSELLEPGAVVARGVTRVAEETGEGTCADDGRRGLHLVGYEPDPDPVTAGSGGVQVGQLPQALFEVGGDDLGDMGGAAITEIVDQAVDHTGVNRSFDADT